MLTLPDCLELEEGLTKSPNRLLVSILKQTFSKFLELPSQIMLMTGVICEVVVPKDKSKSNHFAKQKVGMFSNLWEIHNLYQCR